MFGHVQTTIGSNERPSRRHATNLASVPAFDVNAMRMPAINAALNTNFPANPSSSCFGPSPRKVPSKSDAKRNS